ncbi:MAG: putative LPS assembly protein LptD, partial [Bacteroidota bacterium]
PNNSFSADVNAGTSSNFRTNFNSSSQDFLSNTLQSNITFNRRWPGKPFNLSVSASHSQNTQDSIVNITFPNANFSVNRFYPFKRKKVVGKERFYEKIGVNYNNRLRNQVTAKENELFTQKTLEERMRNGMEQSAQANTSIKVFKYFTLNPSVNYREVWYLETIRRRWNPDTIISGSDTTIGRVETDTVDGFDRYGEISGSMSLTTKIFGFYTFRSEKIQAIRHTITPSISINYKPDYSADRFGYYREVQSDTAGNTTEYSIFDQGIFGAPSRNEAGVINFSLVNNLEMKVGTKDSVATSKKVTIFETFNFTSSYNIAADSLNWSALNITARTQLLKVLNLQASATVDPYALNADARRINVSEWKVNRRLGRVTNARAALGIRLQSKRKVRDTENDKTKEEREQQQQFVQDNPRDLVDFSIPWSLNLNYNIVYSKPGFTSTLTNTVSFRGDFSLTENWKLGFNSGYDFELKDFTYTSFNVYRDLHCWEFRFNIIPFGTRQSYTFDLNVKASVLQDLKVSRKRNWFDLTN